ncbi:hypothetical protein DDI_3789 [Dickeya dianthicola RNS04.9]|nr:hypothetical protein DDI_3789 [Dickeya dianthicola RNS04.9]
MTHHVTVFRKSSRHDRWLKISRANRCATTENNNIKTLFYLFRCLGQPDYFPKSANGLTRIKV